MLKNILIKEYKNLLNVIIKEYHNILKKNNSYLKYVKIINYEVKLIINAFEKLINQKKNTFKSVFEDDIGSILHSIDKQLFGYIKSIFENVSKLLNIK